MIIDLCQKCLHVIVYITGMKTWLIVANASYARIFKIDRQARKLVEVEDFVNPEARLQAKEFASDAPGRSFDSHGAGRHGMEYQQDIKTQSKAQFAQRLINRLEQHFKSGEINHLFIAAPSKLMGHFNDELNGKKMEQISTKIIKDLVRMSSEEIFENLQNALFPAQK